MTRYLVPLLFLSLTGCSGACGLIGQFTGTYEGDDAGNVTLSVENDKGDTIMSITLDGDIAADASGSISCDQGTFSYSLTDADGTEVGTIGGAVNDDQTASGDYSTTDGGAGTWSATGQ